MSGFDITAATTVIGWVGSITGAVFVTWTLVKNKGYEAQREAADSWRSNYESKDAEAKIERERNTVLQSQLTTANTRIAKLEADVLKLEARPDFTLIGGALTALAERTDKYHEAQLILLQKIAESLGAKQ